MEMGSVSKRQKPDQRADKEQSTVTGLMCLGSPKIKQYDKCISKMKESNVTDVWVHKIKPHDRCLGKSGWDWNSCY